MGGSNVLQAFPSYLICLRFIRISTVLHRREFYQHGCWCQPYQHGSEVVATSDCNYAICTAREMLIIKIPIQDDRHDV